MSLFIARWDYLKQWCKANKMVPNYTYTEMFLRLPYRILCHAQHSSVHIGLPAFEQNMWYTERRTIVCKTGIGSPPYQCPIVKRMWTIWRRVTVKSFVTRAGTIPQLPISCPALLWTGIVLPTSPSKDLRENF